MKNALIWSTYAVLCVAIVTCLIGAAAHPLFLIPAGLLLLAYIAVVVLDVTHWRAR